MTTGALIVAAGMSSRMGDFKPMLELGSISVSQRTVTNFRQAGVDKIVMITGYKSVMLERHLAGNGIVFLRNEDYENTQMFDSVKIGLEYLKNMVDVILFTPVDVPLFSASTVEALLARDAKIAMPTYFGEIGHPIKIDSSLVDSILAYSGNCGLKGALDNCGVEISKVEVNDPGILHDADTPEDYTKLLQMHNSQLTRPEISVSLAKETVFFDEKMAMLLSLVKETNSVRTACSRMQISYSTGWNIIRNLENQLTKTLITRVQGGSHGGKSFLTQDGENFLNAYLAYSSEIRKYAGELFSKYF